MVNITNVMGETYQHQEHPKGPVSQYIEQYNDVFTANNHHTLTGITFPEPDDE